MELDWILQEAQNWGLVLLLLLLLVLLKLRLILGVWDWLRGSERHAQPPG